MSLDNTPTEYFGPHAKRWTNPDTGVTYSLKPRDYYQLVAEEKARALEITYHDVEGNMSEKEEQITGAVVNAGPYVISTDGTKTAPLSGWNPPEHQRYDLNAFRQMVDDAEAAAETARTAARSAEDSRDKALEDSGLMIAPNGILVRGRIHSATLSGDGMGYVSSSPAAPSGVRSGERPAGRHWRHRRPQRAARWFAKFGRHPRLWVATGLVYIIAIIGVAAVTGVFS